MREERCESSAAPQLCGGTIPVEATAERREGTGGERSPSQKTRPAKTSASTFRGEGAGITARPHIPVLVPAFLLLTVTAVGAEDRLPEVVVTAPRIREGPAPVEHPTAFATVLDAREAPASVETLADALAETAGVQVRRFGGLGDFSTVSVRGFSPRQMQVYLDGVPLSRADNETVDLSDLPLDIMERVEVYRGVTPLGFAQSGPGGVINVVTRRPGDAPVTAASVSYGSFATRKANVTRSASVGRWDYLLFGHYFGTAGDFRFEDDNGTPENPADDRTAARINNEVDLGSLTARVGFRPWQTLTLALTSDTFGRERGFPGRDTPQDSNARRANVRHLSRLDGRLEPTAGFPVTVDASGWVLYQWARFDDPLGPLIQLATSVEDRSLVGGGQVLLRGAVGAHHVPGLLLALSHETFGQTDDIGRPGALPGEQPDRTRLRGTVALEDEILLLADRVSLLPGLRWEGIRDRAPADPRLAPPLRGQGTVWRSVWSPRLGVRAEPVPGLALRGNAGRYERIPNLQELFGAAGIVVGNPELRPERSLGWDLGLRLDPRPRAPVSATSLEVAYFDNRIDDVVVVVPTSVNVFTSRNIAAARVRGVEVAGALRAWDALGLSANYTFQHAVDESEVTFRRGNRLPGRPAHEAYGRIELGWNAERPLPVGAIGRSLWPGRVWFEVNLIADNYLDTANTRRVPARDLYAAGVEFRPWPSWRLTVEARNLTADQTRDALDFPLPGRAVFATVAWGF